MSKHPLVIIGGNSLIAPWLMQRLRAEGRTADVVSRTKAHVPEGFRFTAMDLGSARNWIAPENAIVVSLLPLWTLVRYMPRFIGVHSIIATGSTSRFSKTISNDAKERAIAANLEIAEHALEEWCVKSNVHRTLLRPTLIYDGMRDQNIARMARFIRRFHFLPIAAPAKGLRQPIHADDVAKAIMKAMDNEAAHGKSFNVAGGEVLTYRAMAERVFAGLGLKPRFLALPVTWLSRAFRVASKTGLVRESSFGSSIFERMNQDLIFDVEEGLRVLSYQPRGFHPEFHG